MIYPHVPTSKDHYNSTRLFQTFQYNDELFSLQYLVNQYPRPYPARLFPYTPEPGHLPFGIASRVPFQCFNSFISGTLPFQKGQYFLISDELHRSSLSKPISTRRLVSSTSPSLIILSTLSFMRLYNISLSHFNPKTIYL